MSAVVELVQISKSFSGVRALREVDLTLQPGSIHALVGENGAGKSTLINILSGVLPPDSGLIRIAGQPLRFSDARAARGQGIVTVHQEVDLFPDLSVAENLGLEQGLPANRLGWINWRTLRHKTRAAFRAVGETLSPTVLASRLTPGQRQLVEIAAAVSQSAKVLILDEPTSSLSEAETELLFSHLRRFRAQGTAIMYVSHRLEEVFALADEVTVLRDGSRVFTGPIRDTPPPRLIGLMVGREINPPQRPARKPGPVRFSCHDLTSADHSFADVTLDVRAGEILGLYGLIGAGRSEWAQSVFGLRRIAGGEMRLDGRPITPRVPGQMMRLGLAYVPEDRLRDGLCSGLTVRANTVLAALRQFASLGVWTSKREEARRTRAAVEQLAIALRSIEQPAGTLSGGNQQKVVLGRWLGCAPQVLILDEPTRGVDVGAKAEIHALVHRLADQGRAIVLISSDLPEVLDQSTRIGVFRGGRLAGIFDGQASPEEIAAAAIPAGSPKTERRPEVSAFPRGRSSSALAGFRLGWPRGGLLREAGLLLMILILFAFLQWRTGEFLRPDKLRNLLTDAALLSFCAIGVAIVVLAGGLDISLGALMALSAGVAGRLWQQGSPPLIVVPTALCVGLAGGLVNAALSLVGRVHPLVITLGTMSVYRGLTLWWLQEDVQIAGSARNWILTETLGVPLVSWAGLAFVALSWLALGWTIPGREVYALGNNPAAAHRVSISRARVWLKAFALQGLLTGLAGLLYLGRSGSLQPTSYEDKTMEAIAAVVVGGVAVTGGRGSVWGVACGCLFLVSLGPACIFLDISTSWQRTLVGGVMVLAVLFDSLWRRSSV
jgi:ABC-type sugar transport system ATPase subunit/ribose/xylose/arabinose/galactoside ABC-type transport system permease subunit